MYRPGRRGSGESQRYVQEDNRGCFLNKTDLPPVGDQTVAGVESLEKYVKFKYDAIWMKLPAQAVLGRTVGWTVGWTVGQTKFGGNRHEAGESLFCETKVA